MESDFAWAFYLTRDLRTMKSEADWSSGHIYRAEQGSFYLLTDVRSELFSKAFGPLEYLGPYRKVFGEDS